VREAPGLIRVFPQPVFLIVRMRPREAGPRINATEGGAMAIFWSLVVYAMVIGLPVFAIWAIVHGIHEDQRPRLGA
jgi:hypothetical protein